MKRIAFYYHFRYNKIMKYLLITIILRREAAGVERMTAEQAAEAARGLTFEKVWAALMESRQSLEESQRETQRRMEESQRETQRRMEESQRETQRRMETSQRESQRRTDKMMADLAKNLGGLGNTLGRFTEAMCANGLYKKFRKLGYTFTKQGERIKFDFYNKMNYSMSTLII